jgi:hypothetical protein
MDNITEFFEGYFAADKAARALVAGELDEMIRAEDIREEKAAKLLQECFEAEKLPREYLAALADDIATAQEQIAAHTENSESDNLALRVDSRAWITAWNDELAKLREKRQRATSDLAPLTAATADARNAVTAAQKMKRDLAYNKSHPFYGYGQHTQAYQTYRAVFGFLVPVIIAGDDTHPEYQPAREMVIRLCHSAGITEDDLKNPDGYPPMNEYALETMKNAWQRPAQ